MPELGTNQPIETDGIEVQKSWVEDGSLYIEGWVSRPGRDRQKHSTTPESLVPSLPEYFQRAAPISMKEHDMGRFPAGHHQRSILIRDGKPLLECEHPTDPAPFRNTPTEGSGWYTRARVNNNVAVDQVQKGNVSSFSYTGHVKSYDILPDGTWEFAKVEPLVETTLTAFPVNPQAIFKVSKSESEIELTKEELEAAFTAALEKRESALAAQLAQAKQEQDNQELVVIKSENATLKTQLETLTTQVTELVAKVNERGKGVGSKAGFEKNDGPNFEDDPVAFLVAKCEEHKRGSEPRELTLNEKVVIGELTKRYLMENLTSDKE